MSIQIQINIQSDDAGDFTEREQTVLAALTGSRADQLDLLHQSLKPRYAEGLSERDIAAHEADSSPTDDQQKLLDASAEAVVEKPKRTRRSKAQIEADRKAEEEGSTGAAVLEDPLLDLGDVEAGDAEQEERIEEEAAEAEQKYAEAVAEGKGHSPTPTAEEPKLEDTAEKTPADALARAATLVETETGQKKVFAALAKVGVERVSLMTTNEQATQFLAEVGA